MNDDRPTFGSLFAGIGGIDLGLERAGWECRFQVEWDAYCQRVLAKHWPDVPRYGDITEVDWSTVEPVDLLAGGFPCQPFSLAGQRRGKSDDRWLWPAFAAAIRALRPRLVLVENVPGLLAGHGGMGSVLGDLAEFGYDAAWGIVSAADVGAPHLRRRVWIVAHADGIEYQGGASSEWWTATTQLLADPILHQLRHEPVALPWGLGATELGHDGSAQPLANPESVGGGSFGSPLDESRRTGGPSGSGECADVAHAASDGREARRQGDATQEQRGRESHRSGIGSDGMADADDAGLQRLAGTLLPEREASAGHGGAGGLGDPDGASEDSHTEDGGPRRATSEPGWWATEPDVGRVAHGVPARVDRLRALGNAVVPQVVEVIGRQLREAMTP